MEEVEYLWFNGKMVKWKEATTHFLTHSLHYGSAVFEGIRCYKTDKGPAIFRLKEHTKRLFYSAKVISMEIPYSEDEINNATLEVVRKNNLEECYIRPLAFFGYGQMGLSTKGCKVDVGIAAWPWGAYLGEEGLKNGIRMKISDWIRPPTNIMPTNAKVSGNYVNSTIAKIDAVNTGYEEAILLDIKGNVAECTGENIFIVKDNVLITPPTSNALKGLTRDSLLTIARDFGIETKEEFFGRKELYAADEAILTGTAAEVTPIREVDGKKIGTGKPGPVTKKLQDKFYEAIRGNDSDYEKWLDYI